MYFILSNMVRYLIRISYIGTKYRGSQKDKLFPNETVQSVIENALCSLKPSNVPLTSFASRTDKGVHALMNTFHVDLEHNKMGEVYQPHFIRKTVNSFLRENNHDILVTNASVVPESFHARFHVKWRSYIYRLAILKPELRVNYSDFKSVEDYLPISELYRCHVVPCDLNINTVKEVLALYHGCHDFTTFTKQLLRDPWKTAIRVIDEFKFYEIPISPHHDPLYSNITMWEFYVKSRSFLYHQIRKMVGCALSAGFGSLKMEDVERMLNKPSPERFQGGYAPPFGLYLANLHYDTEGFVPKEIEIPDNLTENSPNNVTGNPADNAKENSVAII